MKEKKVDFGDDLTAENKQTEESEHSESKSNPDSKSNSEKNEDSNLDLEIMQEKIDSLKNQLIRMQADFTNFKARTKKNEADYVGLGVEKLAEKIFPAIDNFEIALNHIEDEKIYEGIKMIYDQLLTSLEEADIFMMESDNEDFNPDYHYAVITEETDDVESGKVIETLKKGFMHGEKVIRPAMVKVSK